MGHRKQSFITVRASWTQSRTGRKTGTATGCQRWCRVKALTRTLFHAEGNKPESVTPYQHARPHSYWKDAWALHMEGYAILKYSWTSIHEITK